MDQEFQFGLAYSIILGSVSPVEEFLHLKCIVHGLRVRGPSKIVCLCVKPAVSRHRRLFWAGSETLVFMSRDGAGPLMLGSVKIISSNLHPGSKSTDQMPTEQVFGS